MMLLLPLLMLPFTVIFPCVNFISYHTYTVSQMNPMHCIPTLKDGDYTMWESKSILRYIANKHNLESWYPSDPQKRGVVDLALDFCANVFGPVVGPKVAYPKAGFGGPVSVEELEATEKKWGEEVMPAFEHILKRSGGPLLGGAKPNIADLAFLGNLVMVFSRCPDSFVCKTASLVAYYAAAKAALPKYAEAFGASEAFFSS
jgi:glutathione S-transferase